MALPGLDAAVRTLLVGSAPVTGIVGQKVYNLQAPASAALPYLIFYQASGVLPNAQPRDTLNHVFRVEARASSGTGAITLAGAVFDALHEQVLTLSGWTNYWMVVTNETVFIENVDGVQYYRRVYDIRIKASKNS